MASFPLRRILPEDGLKPEEEQLGKLGLTANLRLHCRDGAAEFDVDGLADADAEADPDA
jgi:hypothetical protein